ncbi:MULTISPECIES: DUF4013 domain-containing protein [Haloferax]|uniref:DUF4013 domain-containing protein n=2 Tax=Haloferax TaxID=2251 RepID=A0A6C0UWF2_HALVO|nr:MULTISPECIES: DUF4013 domain-containing protein [Haloferax]ELK56291.1 hypothetical protein D320_00060 [Haloferax sp. BAB-2207]MBC9987532.1 DUF4013 domain-containing protein [Haloferax sp. AS1]NLV04467.1 DUF4013 domain-containing protein [Haloferax alexandrinus]QIB79886.1 DUF4013 domain-containing protein [Haloferax alexandrinus]RDZ31855.1 DUF4013 domain-containing protein [Haloferax sp. Atlit-48N]
MLSDALWFLKRSDDWVATTIIGGVLWLLSVLIFPGIILQGYFVRAMRAAANGERAAPSFTDWGELFVDGLKLFVVTFVWALVAIVPAILLSVIIGIGTFTVSEAATGSAAASSAGGVGLGIASLVLGLLVFVLGLLAAYIGPAAGANFAIEGNLGAGFDVRTILSGAFTGEYAVAWLLALVVTVVLGFIGGLLSAIVVGFFVLFYVQVMTYYLWARGFADATGKGRQSTGW